MPDLWTLPARGTAPRVPSITAAEATRRVVQVRTAASRSRPDFPLASAHLLHWIDGAGRRRDIPLSEFDFADATCGVPGRLRDHTWYQLAAGNRFDSDIGGSGVEGRLRLPETNANSLRRPGSRQTLRIVDSHRARPMTVVGRSLVETPHAEQDLSIAMGGYTIACEVTVESRAPAGNRQEVFIVDWKVQIIDRYDWIAGAPALVPVPPGRDVSFLPDGAGSRTTLGGVSFLRTNDTWFQQLEQAGFAHWFDVYSEIFQAPANLRRTFVAVGGTIALREQSLLEQVDQAIGM